VRRFCELIDPACAQYHPGYRDVIVEESHRARMDWDGLLDINPAHLSDRSRVGSTAAFLGNCCGGSIPPGIIDDDLGPANDVGRHFTG
jgi:hypothetical protein